MKILQKNKGLIATVFIFIIALFVYNTFFAAGNIAIPDELSASTVGEDLLKLHNELQMVTLDRSILSSPGYLGLDDFTVPITSQPTGRPNPFEIIGRD